MRRLIWPLVVVGVLLLLCSCLLVLFAPRKAGATGLDCTFDGVAQTASCTETYPTQIPYPYPTACVSPVASGDPVCGVAAVAVGHSNGEGGALVLLLIVNAIGLGVLVVVQIVYGFIRR